MNAALAYDYYPLVLRVLELISQGETETRACDTVRITVIAYRKYIQATPELQEIEADAFARGRDAMADMLMHIDDDRLYGRSDSKMAKVISENIKWLLSKRDPKNFGDKMEVTHNVTMDKAIIQQLELARTRSAGLIGREPMTIDALPVMDEDARLLQELLS